MKKIILAISATTTIMFLAANSSIAQAKADMAIANSTTKSSSTGEAVNASNLTSKSKMAAKAFKDFSRSFKNVSNASWEITNEGAFVATFNEEKTNNKVYYSPNGNYLCTIIRYSEKEMPQSVRQMVKSTYYDYSITTVEEVQFSSSHAYRVHIDDGKHTKIIRVTDEGMDVIEELTRP